MRHVLVLEDNEDVAAVIGHFLEADDVIVDVITTDFEEYVRDGKIFDSYDAVVCDHWLGGTVSGCAIAQLAQRSGVPHVLLITATPLDEMTCDGIPLLRKPFLAEELLSALWA